MRSSDGGEEMLQFPDVYAAGSEWMISSLGLAITHPKFVQN
jgi:hypothetical protein